MLLIFVFCGLTLRESLSWRPSTSHFFFDVEISCRIEGFCEMANEERGDKFEIRTLTKTSTGLKKYFLDALEKEKFFPALDDIECYLACDPTSLLVGELDGKPIAIAAMFKYEEQYRHFGCYVVDKAYRGQGYGLKITAEARRRSEPNGIESLHAVPAMLEKYKNMPYLKRFNPPKR